MSWKGVPYHACFYHVHSLPWLIDRLVGPRTSFRQRIVLEVLWSPKAIKIHLGDTLIGWDVPLGFSNEMR